MFKEHVFESALNKSITLQNNVYLITANAVIKFQ